MRLVMTLLVRDEEDILDWNLRYHLSRGVDHIIVTDNLSVDRTPAILRRYERRGVATVIRETADDYSQSEWVTRMALLAQRKHSPDWLLHSDADEFLWPETGGSLKEAFSRVAPHRSAIRISRRNYLGGPVDTGEPFFERMIHRDDSGLNSNGAPLLPKVAHRPLPWPRIHQGNHAVSDVNGVVETADAPGLVILHFPARSRARLRRKVEKGGAAYARNTRLPESVGRTWRRMYDAISNGEFDRHVATQFVESEAEARRRALVPDRRLAEYLRAL